MERRTRGVRPVENATNHCSMLSAQADTALFAGARGCSSCGQPLGMQTGQFGIWDAFPAGVKFDPSDEELLVHLAAEMGCDNAAAHPFIKNFISVLEGEEGICQTHPENLPGVKKDGSSKHFFHRPTKAYTTGTRKRRKIHSEDDEPGVETRWHKTGKTRSVTEDGRVLGWKKIMVLYRSTGSKKSKPEKTNWILHQYHLGQTEEETEGELVVCKVFYQKQPRQCTGPRPAETATEMENVDLNNGSRDATTCVSSVSRGTPPSSKLDTLQTSAAATVQKMRGTVTQSSKGSELTVLDKEAPAAAASELTSNPVYQSIEAPIPDTRNGSIVSEGEFVPAEQDKAGQGYYYAADSQQPYPDEDSQLFCEEVFGVDSFLNMDGFSVLGNPEEPVISNPHEDYPPVEDITLLESPPALNTDYILSSQEAHAVMNLKPPAAQLNHWPFNFFDNDDSLSST